MDNLPPNHARHCGKFVTLVSAQSERPGCYSAYLIRSRRYYLLRNGDERRGAGGAMCLGRGVGLAVGSCHVYG